MTPIEANKKTLALIKFSFLLNFVLMCIVIALSVAIISLFPLKENTPYLVRFSDLQNSFVTIEKADASLQSNKALIKFLLDAYVQNRETIDRATHNNRRRLVMLYSSVQEQKRYSDFLLLNRQAIETEGFFRQVKINSISLVSANVGIVEFTLTDTYESDPQNISTFKATIAFDFKEIKLSRSDEYENPVGLLVEEYQISAVKTENTK
ncbi:MAG: VirB8/TrbF family protein [Helicobacteraceae bacterium]